MKMVTKMSKAPRSQRTAILGRLLQNVGPKWYKRGGTFCSVCRVAYNFEESHLLYLRNLELGMTHGIPRCLYCSRSLRTRSKSNPESGFYRKLDELKNPKPESSWGV